MYVRSLLGDIEMRVVEWNIFMYCFIRKRYRIYVGKGFDLFVFDIWLSRVFK